jgi:hypothetical protein
LPDYIYCIYGYLPSFYATISTPIKLGLYSIILQQKLVAQENFAGNGRGTEKAKVKCGKKHFVEALSVAYEAGNNARDMLSLI